MTSGPSWVFVGPVTAWETFHRIQVGKSAEFVYNIGTTCGCPLFSTTKCTGVYVEKKLRKTPVLNRRTEKGFFQKKAKFLYFEIGVWLVVVMGRDGKRFFFIEKNS